MSVIPWNTTGKDSSDSTAEHIGMTGPEWLARYQTEKSKLLFGNIKPEEVSTMNLYDEAARRASGVDDDRISPRPEGNPTQYVNKAPRN